MHRHKAQCFMHKDKINLLVSDVLHFENLSYQMQALSLVEKIWLKFMKL